MYEMRGPDQMSRYTLLLLLSPMQSHYPPVEVSPPLSLEGADA